MGASKKIVELPNSIEVHNMESSSKEVASEATPEPTPEAIQGMKAWWTNDLAKKHKTVVEWRHLGFWTETVTERMDCLRRQIEEQQLAVSTKLDAFDWNEFDKEVEDCCDDFYQMKKWVDETMIPCKKIVKEFNKKRKHIIEYH